MTKKIVSDLDDGMTCLIVGMWTPAVMITLRAVEGMLRKFYKKVKGSEIELIDETFLNWGTMLKNLDASTHPLDKDLLNNLRYLKIKRNEAQHPEKRFTKDDAENSFIKAREAIKSMISSGRMRRRIDQ
ncbi:MAG: hypothetical protein M1481_05310 [Candidatus Thermoplasmatota archaeon]|jgi:hypothetical protein|nr:hypothetical protein [Candidatus Thermoplasmatota archaeon]MCL5963632.1 hypothetical protein [Candidatus Thermoplasmatota archaeon]